MRTTGISMINLVHMELQVVYVKGIDTKDEYVDYYN